MSITDTSTLLQGNPPQKRTSVRFCLVRHFRHFPWHSDFCFPRSTNEPVSSSCHLNAACHLARCRLNMNDHDLTAKATSSYPDLLNGLVLLGIQRIGLVFHLPEVDVCKVKAPDGGIVHGTVVNPTV